MATVRKVRIIHRTAPGDTVVLSAAVKALMVTNPRAFLVDYAGNWPELFENNPYITPLSGKDIQEVTLDYGEYIQRVGIHCRHFLESFCLDLGRRLGVSCELQDFRGDLYLSDAEREPWPGLPERYWIVDAGCKPDMTAKMWSRVRFQQVVDAFAGRVQFVQIGSADPSHKHAPLSGVIDLRGQTTLRQLIQVVYRANGVLTPVSLPMHLAAAVPVPEGCRERGCVVIAGWREPRHWEAYPGHVYLGGDGRPPMKANGEGPCCGAAGGCWRTKIDEAENEGHLVYELRPGFKIRQPKPPALCYNIVHDEATQKLPRCLADVTVEQVVVGIKRFL